MRLHHIGIATDDAAGRASAYAELFSAEVAHEETFEGDLEVVFIDVGGVYLELLAPREGHEGPIARHLESRGPGLHHVAMLTDDVAAALDDARALGIEPVDESPRPGAWDTKIAFLHPRSLGGLLVELVER